MATDTMPMKNPGWKRGSWVPMMSSGGWPGLERAILDEHLMWQLWDRGVQHGYL